MANFIILTEVPVIGIPSADRQHQDLARLLNTIEETVSRPGTGPAAVGLVEQMLLHVRVHFTLEEALMEHAEYPGLDDHRDSHRELTGQLQTVLDALRRDRALVDATLLRFLKRWFLDHIHNEDAGYAEWIRRHRPALLREWIGEPWPGADRVAG